MNQLADVYDINRLESDQYLIRRFYSDGVGHLFPFFLETISLNGDVIFT